jgi:hypothetical protein
MILRQGIAPAIGGDRDWPSGDAGVDARLLQNIAFRNIANDVVTFADVLGASVISCRVPPQRGIDQSSYVHPRGALRACCSSYACKVQCSLCSLRSPLGEGRFCAWGAMEFEGAG